MNKKLPNLYRCNKQIMTNNKKTYYSLNNKQEKNNNENKSNSETTINYFYYFNKKVKIITNENETIETKILSKNNNKLLLEDGTYIKVEQIKSIN